VTLEFLAKTIAQAAGTAILPFKIPAQLAQMGATLCEALCKPLRIEPPLHHRRLDFFVRDQAFDISKSQRVLGFEPQVNVRNGVARTVNWYREQGWL
jgi:dihydroflavonol-4-reductase